MESKIIRRVRLVRRPPQWMFGTAMNFIGPYRVNQVQWERLYAGRGYYRYRVMVELQRGSRFVDIIDERAMEVTDRMEVYRKMPFWTACRLLWWLLWSRPA